MVEYPTAVWVTSMTLVPKTKPPGAWAPSMPAGPCLSDPQQVGVVASMVLPVLSKAHMCQNPTQAILLNSSEGTATSSLPCSPQEPKQSSLRWFAPAEMIAQHAEWVHSIELYATVLIAAPSRPFAASEGALAPKHSIRPTEPESLRMAHPNPAPIATSE